MAHLRELQILDLSNNDLEGAFPEWVHSLPKLKVLNLGQNSFSGDVPLVIGGRLKSLRKHFSRYYTDIQFQYYQKQYTSLRRKYMDFLKTRHPYLKDSKDFLWLSHQQSPFEYKDHVNAYIEAEPIYQFSRLFSQIRDNPVEVIRFLTEHQSSMNSQTKGRKTQSLIRFLTERIKSINRQTKGRITQS